MKSLVDIKATDTAAQVKKKIVACPLPIMMLYVMNGCPHCTSLKPTWEAACVALQSTPNIVCAQVEYHQIPKLPLDLQNVSGFPTIQVVHNSKVVAEYSGDRTQASIVAFAMSHTMPPKPKVPKTTSATPKAKPRTKKPAKASSA